MNAGNDRPSPERRGCHRRGTGAPPNEAAVRLCLKCRKPFKSKSRFHRICADCNIDNKQYHAHPAKTRFGIRLHPRYSSAEDKDNAL